MKTRRGYTLIEVLAVLVIIGLLAGIATPYFLTWLQQYRLNAATVVLANHLRTGRLLAMYKGVKHQFQFKKAGEGNYYQLVEDPGKSDILVASIGRIGMDKQFGGIRIQSIPSNGRLTFSPRGTSQNGTILLENTAGAQAKIIVNNFGRVKIEYLD